MLASAFFYHHYYVSPFIKLATAIHMHLGLAGQGSAANA